MTSLALSPMAASATVAIGGAIGAVGRYQLGRAVTHYVGVGSGFPWPTLAANVIGSLAMGLLFGWLARHGGASDTMRLFLGVGLLGGFTTFSAFSLEMLLLIERGSVGLAVLYAAISVLAGLAALYIGLLIMRGAA
ncbi:fluoride efflux transporter CrcB [Erythrobacter crassostreae]|uniref:Fluoride-specific ion channel FluC n=1 Tax=Erythrobacter crassostreae TaxID=2828328 RepID=A0A9X1F3S7_9SPHN|nr:fluoride efflux transporter CrcB [Erythrobacter crassostrea]MBV7259219.1 fluoride efflux transporter CrcB [Erythrobacter crassostrea]